MYGKSPRILAILHNNKTDLASHRRLTKEATDGKIIIGGNERNFFTSPVVLNNLDDRANNKYQSMDGGKSYNCVLWQNTPRRQHNEDIKISFHPYPKRSWKKWLNDVFYSGKAFEETSSGSGFSPRTIRISWIEKVFPADPIPPSLLCSVLCKARHFPATAESPRGN